MLDNIKKEYKKYLLWDMWFQKNIWKFNFENLILISWITCIWKNFFIKKYNLISLYSYKTSNWIISLRDKQIYLKPEKFYEKMLDWFFFDIYWLNNKFYWYSLEDYFILQKEYWKVFIDISIENIFNWLNFWVKNIFILDYSEEQLEKNIKKRIKERNYDEKRIKEMYKIINKEKEILNKIKNSKKYKNIIYIKNIKDFLKYNYK